MIWNEWTQSQGLLLRAEQWAKQNQTPLFHRVTSLCPVLALEYATEEKMIASYSSKMRTDLRRRKKKLKALDSEVLHLRPSASETPILVEKMRATEAASWKGGEGVGIFNGPLSYAFFKDLSLRLAAYDQLDLSIVNIDGELASYKYGFYFRKTFYDYSIGYLPQYSKLGLGRILLDELALAALRKGYKAVDASRVGATTQHLLLERTNKTIPHYRVYWFGTSLKSKLLMLLVMHGKPRMNLARKKYRKWIESREAIQRKAER
jgi:GNAT superfamily N-acetyltransferase